MKEGNNILLANKAEHEKGLAQALAFEEAGNKITKSGVTINGSEKTEYNPSKPHKLTDSIILAGLTVSEKVKATIQYYKKLTTAELSDRSGVGTSNLSVVMKALELNKKVTREKVAGFAGITTFTWVGE